MDTVREAGTRSVPIEAVSFRWWWSQTMFEHDGNLGSDLLSDICPLRVRPERERLGSGSFEGCR
jgi:hypothetical protein